MSNKENTMDVEGGNAKEEEKTEQMEDGQVSFSSLFSVSEYF